MCARAQCAARETVDWGHVPRRRHAWLPSDIGGLRSALGRAGDGPKAFPSWEAALVALCGARGGDFRFATFPRLAPPGPQVPEVRLGPNFARFLERCPLDSEFSCDHFLSFESMFFLRSSNPFDGWFSLPPPQHGPYISANTARAGEQSVQRWVPLSSAWWARPAQPSAQSRAWRRQSRWTLWRRPKFCKRL